MQGQKAIKPTLIGKTAMQPGSFRCDGHRGCVGFRARQALTVYDADFSVDRIGNLSRRKSKPSLIGMAATHPSICVLENLIAHAPPRLVSGFQTHFGAE
jgi:hypothetical protein